MNMSCNFEKDLLSACHDGELDARERGRVEEHVAACADCARELADIRAVSSQLRSAGRMSAPVQVAEELRREVAPARSARVFRIRHFVEAGLAAAAGLLIVLSGAAIFGPAAPGREPAAASPAADRVASGRAKEESQKLAAEGMVHKELEKSDRDDLAQAPRPSDSRKREPPAGQDQEFDKPMAKAVPAPAPIQPPAPAAPPPPAAEPGMAGGRAPAGPAAPAEEPGDEGAAPDAPGLSGTYGFVVVGDNVVSADEAVNELLRKLSKDYRRRDSVWEATLSEKDAQKLLSALESRKDLVIDSAPPIEGEMARLAEDTWQSRAENAGKKVGRVQDQQLAKQQKGYGEKKEGLEESTPPEAMKPGVPQTGAAAPTPSGGGSGDGAKASDELARRLRSSLDAKQLEEERKAEPAKEPATKSGPLARGGEAAKAKDKSREPEENLKKEAERLVTLRIYIVSPDNAEKVNRLKNMPAQKEK